MSILPDDMSEEEIEYHTLIGKAMKATTDEEEAKAMKKINQFRKEHPVIADEIQSRRWLID